MASITFEKVTKSFGSNTVIENLDLEIEDGSFTVLVGPSGCGKTTLLRMIAGIGPQTSGRVLIDGKDVTQIAPGKRGVAMVFQNYAIYPTMTVRDNIEFGLKNNKVPKAERAKLISEACEKVGLTQYLDRKPSTLSGGQRQRVALARAIVKNPSVFLMDEPLSNLDAKLRLEMRSELQRLHLETGSTFVYVTHDQMEAMTLATQICLINNGVLQQYEAPLEVYHHPANLFVADFVGNPSINFVEARGKQAADGSLTLTVLGGLTARFRPAKALELSKWFADRDAAAAKKAADLKEKAAQKGYVEKGNKDEVFRYHIAKVDEEDDSLAELPEITNEDFVLGIRPEFLDIADEGKLRGEIYGAMPTGMESTIKVRVGGFLLTGVVFGSSLFTIGTEVPLSVTGDQIMLFDRKSGQCITSGTLNF